MQLKTSIGLAGVAFLTMAGPAAAHSGGLDKYGCHNDRKNGGYHCHRGSPAPAPSRPARQSPPAPTASPIRSSPQSLMAAPSVTSASRPVALVTPASVPQPAASAVEPVITGRAQVIDGDTLTVGATRVKLWGIDAFEALQTCGQGQPLACGAKAIDTLQIFIGREAPNCVKRGVEPGGQVLAVCRVGMTDLAALVVRQGYALADRARAADYINDEEAARSMRVGAWSTTGFVSPSDYRAGRRDVVAISRPNDRGLSEGCVIKASVVSGAKVYRMPGDFAYDDIKADAVFCSEEAVIGAGFRRIK